MHQLPEAIEVCPLPAVLVDCGAQGMAVLPNSAARRMSATAGWQDADWANLGTAIKDVGSTKGALRHGSYGMAWRCGEFGDALLSWLFEPAAESRPAGSFVSPDAHLSLAADMLGLALWRLDMLTLRLHLNDSGYRQMGLAPSPDGLPLSQVNAAMHPDDILPGRQASHQVLRDGGVADCEERYRLPGGGWRTLMVRRTVERSANGYPALVGVSMDVSELVDARTREHEAAASLNLIVEATGVAIWSIEPALARVHWNPVMYALFSVTDDISTSSAAREAFLRHVHPDDLERVRVAYDSPQSLTDAGEIEFRLQFPDGSLRWLQARGRSMALGESRRIVGVVLDVTDRREAYDRIRHAEIRTRLATSGVGIAVWECDLATGELIWDEQMYRLRGVAPDDPRRPIELHQQLTHPKDLELLRLGADHVPLREAEQYQAFRVLWPDGSLHWLSTRFFVMRDERGAAQRCFGVNVDITAEKLGEESRRRQAAAEAANRAKSLFLARMSHELRTPLNAVLGFSQMMASDANQPLAPKQAARLSLIRDAGQHLLALISDTLDLASIELGTLPVSRELVDLRLVAEQAMRWVGLQAERAQVRVELGDIDVWVDADARRLCQVLVNLLSNAIKYNRRGGWVKLAVSADRTVNRVVVVVTDNGRGMSPDQLGRLFMPFERLGMESEAIEGSGIGLSLAYHLVRRMGGSISAQSTLDQGSSFRLDLALAGVVPESGATGARLAGAARRAALDAPPQPALMPAPVQALRDLLLVDDDPINQLLVQELMALRPGLRLHTASDGTSAMIIARRTRPALVFLDLFLPDFDGFDVLRRMNADPLLAGTTAIAMSASITPATRQRAQDAGFADCWEKPIDAHRFLAALDRWLEKPLAGEWPVPTGLDWFG